MPYKPKEIIKRAKKMKKSGVVYGYGYKYETVTSSNISRYGKLYAYTTSQYVLMRRKIGKKAIDCSGFVNRAAGTNLGGSSDIRNSSPKTYPISDTSHRQNGMFIWRDGHIGLIYKSLGKWYIIEAASTAQDLTIRTWGERASHFTRYGKIKGVNYGSSTSRKKSTSTKNTTDSKAYTQKKFVSDLRKILELDSKASKDKVLKHVPYVSITKNRYARVITPLERRLKELGFYKGVIEADEGRSPIFGNGLKSAVIAYQKKYVHPHDMTKCKGGLVNGGATWKKLIGA